MSLNRLPPQDVDTEIACLSSALLSKEALLKISEILHAEDFYLDKHRIIFEAIQDLEKRNPPVDLTTLKKRLEDRGLFDNIGGEPSLVELYQSASTSANAEFYARRIKNSASGEAHRGGDQCRR